MDFATILDESAARYPDRIAIEFADEQVTFAALANQVARLAGGFVHHGLVPGDRLAILLPSGLHSVKTLLAATRAELIAVPISPIYAPPQIEYILRHSGSRVLLTNSTLLARVSKELRNSLEAIVTSEPTADFPCLNAWLAPTPAPPVRTCPDPIGLLVYTSGTTSRPKGVAHSQHRMAHRVDLFVDEMNLGGDDTTLTGMDVTRPIILLGQFLPMLRTGGRIRLLSRFDPTAFWNAYAEIRPSFLLTAPGVAVDLLDHPDAAKHDHSRLRFWITGGDKAPALLYHRMSEVIGRPLLEMCGMTETGFYAVTPPGSPIKAGSIGQAMRGVAIRLLGEDGSDVPAGQVGRLFVRTSDMMIGYWNDTLQTHRFLREGWLDTGDLAWADADGYLWFVGRAKDMIDRGGFKVAPAMVEEALQEHPAVARAAVVGGSDARYGQVPVAFYEVQAGFNDPGTEQLRSWALERLDPVSIPVKFIRVERWPLTAQNKLDRARLVWMAEADGHEL